MTTDTTYDDHLPEDDLVDPTYETVEVEAVAPEIVQKGLGFKSLLATGLIAAVLGALGGGAIAYSLRPDAPNLSAVEARLKSQNTQTFQAMEQRVASAERVAKAAASNVPAPMTLPEMPDLSPLEARLSALETASPPEIDADAMAALQAAQADGFDWPDTEQIEAVLISLDERLIALENRPAPKVVAQTAAPGFSMTLDPPSAPTPEVPPTEPQYVLAFPKDAMLKAVDDTRSGGFLKRALSKHVQVKTEDDPVTLINGITVDIAKGRLDLAANKYERLPSPVRDAGRAWYDSVPTASKKAAP